MKDKIKQVQKAMESVYVNDDLSISFSLIWSNLYGWSVEGEIESDELETPLSGKYNTPTEALDAFLAVVNKWKQEVSFEEKEITEEAETYEDAYKEYHDRKMESKIEDTLAPHQLNLSRPLYKHTFQPILDCLIKKGEK